MNKVELPKVNDGEHYAGLLLSRLSGAPTHHVILLAEMSKPVTFAEAQQWVSQLGTPGAHLPYTREQALLMANLASLFGSRVYWLGRTQKEKPYGFRFHPEHHIYPYDPNRTFRACAVRSVPIDEVNHEQGCGGR